jgi:hypothetical protein
MMVIDRDADAAMIVLRKPEKPTKETRKEKRK